MPKEVVSVRFKSAGKRYYFDPKNIPLEPGDKVVVETVRGIEIGEVAEAIKTVTDKALIETLKPVIRQATEKDLKKEQRNIEEIPTVMKTCAELVKKHALEMKLLDAEYTLDRAKLIIYFTADGRIDFRELVKDLANAFRVRIELRQVGARDGAKFLGGVGPCGYILCCNSFLGEFEAVSIKMAKNQNLALNPANISGLCGKLLCCIRYENETYSVFRKTLPKPNTRVKTKDGRGKVLTVNVIDRFVKVALDNDTIRHYKVDDLLEIDEYDGPKVKKG